MFNSFVTLFLIYIYLVVLIVMVRVTRRETFSNFKLSRGHQFLLLGVSMIGVFISPYLIFALYTEGYNITVFSLFVRLPVLMVCFFVITHFLMVLFYVEKMEWRAVIEENIPYTLFSFSHIAVILFFYSISFSGLLFMYGSLPSTITLLLL